MEFYQLRSFVVVAETQNLTKAAKHLYSTPSAVSAHIKALEQELNTELFVRSSKGMKLTEKGHQLLLKAQKTLDAAVDMVNLATESQHELIGELHIGINQPVEALGIQQLLLNLNENCPGISLAITSSSTGKILDAIHSDELQGGYVYGNVPANFIALPIKEVKITTIAPISFDLDKAKTTNDLKTAPWITMDKYCPFDDVLKKSLGNDVNAITKSSDESSRLALVKSEVGLSFLEDSLAEKAKAANEVKTSTLLDFSIPLSFVVAQQQASNPLIKALLQEVRVLWNIAL